MPLGLIVLVRVCQRKGIMCLLMALRQYVDLHVRCNFFKILICMYKHIVFIFNLFVFERERERVCACIFMYLLMHR